MAGVSSRLTTWSPGKPSASPNDATEMPRCFSISIQSDVAWRLALRPFTAPAIWIAPGEQQQFFRQRGLTCVRVGNDGEGAAALVSGA